MKAKDVKIGSTYLVKVSGQVVPVRVTGSREVAAYGRNGHRMAWEAINLTTGRRIVVRSPQRFRARFERKAEVPVASERVPSGQAHPG